MTLQTAGAPCTWRKNALAYTSLPETRTAKQKPVRPKARQAVLASAFEYVPSCATKLCDRFPEYDGSSPSEEDCDPNAYDDVRPRRA